MPGTITDDDYKKLVKMIEKLEGDSVRTHLCTAAGEMKSKEEVEEFLHFMFSLPHAGETLRIIGYGDYVDIYEKIFGPMG